MAEYRKLHDDVECLGKLTNFDGYVFKDRFGKLHFIHSSCMEDYALPGMKGFLYFKVHSGGSDHIFKSKEINFI